MLQCQADGGVFHPGLSDTSTFIFCLLLFYLPRSSITYQHRHWSPNMSLGEECECFFFGFERKRTVSSWSGWVDDTLMCGPGRKDGDAEGERHDNKGWIGAPSISISREKIRKQWSWFVMKSLSEDLKGRAGAQTRKCSLCFDTLAEPLYAVFPLQQTPRRPSQSPPPSAGGFLDLPAHECKSQRLGSCKKKKKKNSTWP